MKNGLNANVLLGVKEILKTYKALIAQNSHLIKQAVSRQTQQPIDLNSLAPEVKIHKEMDF